MLDGDSGVGSHDEDVDVGDCPGDVAHLRGRRRWSRWAKKRARIRVTQFTERSFHRVGKSSG